LFVNIETYEQFKVVVKRLLPHVYDTKFMIGACRRSFCHHTLQIRKDEKDKLKLSGLSIAYYMTSCAITKFAPEIELDAQSQHFKSSKIWRNLLLTFSIGFMFTSLRVLRVMDCLFPFRFDKWKVL